MLLHVRPVSHPGEAVFSPTDSAGEPYVNSTTTSAIFTTTVNTYTPYLELGDMANPNPSGDAIILGRNYQEILTDFPLQNHILTGLFLNVTLLSLQGPAEVFQHTILDRFGYAARQSNAVPTSLSVGGADGPALNELDVCTVNVLPGMIDANLGISIARQLSSILDLVTSLSQDSGPLPPAAGAITRATSVDATRTELCQFLDLSDHLAGNLAALAEAKGYFDTPRVTISTSSYSTTDSTLTLGLDLLQDSMRTIADPTQRDDAGLFFKVQYGLIESAIESVVASMGQMIQTVSTTTIIETAIRQGIPLVSLTPGSISEVSDLTLSPEARAQITKALQDGRDLLVPSEEVSINGTAVCGWYELDPNTGTVQSLLENGTHGATIEVTSIEVLQTENETAILIRFEIHSIARLRELESESTELVELVNDLREAKELGRGIANALSVLKEFLDFLKNLLALNPEGLVETDENLFFSLIIDVLLEGVDPPVQAALFNLAIPNPLPATPQTLTQGRTIGESTSNLVNGNVRSLSLSASHAPALRGSPRRRPRSKQAPWKPLMPH